MKYLYYPGCSLKGSGRPYEESFLQLLNHLQVPYEELTDWNCCGATAYMAIDETNAHALAARNLAMASQFFGDGTEEVHLLAPCNACFLVLLKAKKAMTARRPVGRIVANELVNVGLRYCDRVKIRHPLDLLVNDVGLERLKASVRKPLRNVKVACYYGCQVVRPYSPFDDQRNPQSMDRLLRAMGAQPVDWSMKVRCCGGTLTGTVEEAGQRLSYFVLKEARRKGAEVVATACPLCQFNLECYQRKMEERWGGEIGIPVLYFTQLMGQAFGIENERLWIDRMFVQPTHSWAGAV